MTTTTSTGISLDALAGDPAALDALADQAAAELAAMRESAAAFLDRFAGGRGLYSWPPGRAHYMFAANVFAAPLMPVPDPARRPVVRLSTAQDQAARLAGTLWQAISFSGGTATRTYRHFPAAVDPEWLAGLALPTTQALPPGQPAGLLDGTGPIERHLDSATLAAACAHRPRTRVFEDIGHGQSGSWAALAGQQLTRQAGGPRVTCSVFESAQGDATLAPHPDAWFGVVVQVSGAKRWHLGEQLAAVNPPPAALGVTTRAGDILLVPKNLLHVVSTPADPGHSVHLAFALDRDQPSTAQPQATPVWPGGTQPRADAVNGQPVPDPHP